MICKYYLEDPYPTNKCVGHDCGRCENSPAYKAGKRYGIRLAINNVKFFDYRGVTLETMNKITDGIVKLLEGIM